MTEPGTGFHARALRAIGQDLADLLPENFAIEPSGEDFIAHGMCSRARLETTDSVQCMTGLRKLGAKLRAGVLKPSTRQPDLDLAAFTRRYNARAIEQLDEQGNQRRGRIAGIPEIYSLGERLRTIGKVIDSHDGRLIRIYKDLHHILFEYRDGDGNLRKVEMDNTELYRLQRRYTTERSDDVDAEFDYDHNALHKSQ
jgi:hypothetical protein